MEDRPRLREIEEQFTRTADVYARMRQATDERALRGLVALSGTEPAHRVLDVACGPGFLTLAFAERCASATGVDATDAFLAMARTEAARRGLGNAEFRRGDAEKLPFGDGAFDVVACRAAFHHFPEPPRVLAEMRRVVKPAGRLLVADLLGSEDPATARAHDAIERLCDPTHVRALPERELAALFGEAGLEPEHAVRTELSYDLEEWIAHGDPAPAARAEIVRRMEAALADDRTGLRVRREDGRIRFSHRAAAFVLQTR
jgi:ubiquinone/menaquinone biosynthesis C-methylase UbiE